MKKIIIVLMLLPVFAFAQRTDPNAFSREKRSIKLSTGIVMKYVETGDKDGIPILFLHGFTDTGRSFQQVMQGLTDSRKNFRLIAPDLRGHGATSMPAADMCAGAPENCFTFADFTADIIDLMDKKQIAKAHIVGHSMGSMIAQRLALTHPHRVSSLVLIGTCVYGKDHALINGFLNDGLVEGTWRPLLEKGANFQWPRDAYTVTPDMLGEEVTTYLKNNWVTELSAPADFLQAIAPETNRTAIGTWVGGIRTLRQFDHREALEDLNVPTLILWGTQDVAFAEADQQRVRDAFSQAVKTQGTKVIFKTYGKVPLPASGAQESDLGHNLHWAAPRPVANDIALFVTTGWPVSHRPYLNPRNVQQLLIEQTSENIIELGGGSQ